MIAEWIARAAARQGGAPYLEDAAGTGIADLCRPAALHPGLGRLPGPRRGAARGPGGRPPAGPARLRHRPGQHPRGRPGGRPAGPGAPAADLSRVLAAARPEAAVSDSGGGLPPGLAVLRPPDRSFGPNGPAPARPPSVRSSGRPVAGSGGIFLCTSGTTGAPKGILLREDQLCHVAAAVADHHRLLPADRGYCCLPLFHVNAEVVGLLATLAAGACLVLDRKFSRRRILGADRAAADHLDQRGSRDHRRAGHGSVRRSRPPGASASSVRPPLRCRRRCYRRFEEAFGIPVVETYGMTEAASMITANPLDGPRKAGSVGPASRTRGPGSPASRRAVRAGPALEVGRVQIRGRGVITRVRGGRPGRGHRPRRLARHRRPGPPGPGRLPVPGRAVRRRDQPGRREDLPEGNRGLPARPARRPVRRGGRGSR